MAEQWYVGRNGQKAGPYSTEQLKQMAAAGQLVTSDLLWKQGLESWVPCTEVKGLLPAMPGGTLPPLDLPSRNAGEWNPYQASIAGDLAVDASQAIVYADFLPRVGAYLLDAIFIGLISMILQFGLLILFGIAAGGDDGMLAAGNAIGSLLGLAVTMAYFVGYETSAKQGTWGKQILGIKVTDMEGRRITTGRAIGRFFAKIVSGLTCGIGFLLPLFTDRKQTLHDLICGCLALKK